MKQTKTLYKFLKHILVKVKSTVKYVVVQLLLQNTQIADSLSEDAVHFGS